MFNSHIPCPWSCNVNKGICPQRYLAFWACLLFIILFLAHAVYMRVIFVLFCFSVWIFLLLPNEQRKKTLCFIQNLVVSSHEGLSEYLICQTAWSNYPKSPIFLSLPCLQHTFSCLALLILLLKLYSHPFPSADLPISGVSNSLSLLSC